MTNPRTNRPKPRPPWLRKRMSAGTTAPQVARMLEDLHLVTVCDGAHCPNRHECFARGTATFMILGAACTRNCGFCAVESAQSLAPPRDDEPDAVAEAAKRLGLRHVVITSVTRDDLPDGGAGHFARTILSVRGQLPDAVIEVLVPDFLGSTDSIDIVLSARPHVFNHNVETVPRLYPTVRPQADYQRSLDVLGYVKKKEKLAEQTRPLNGAETVLTKSGLMVGLGEQPGEVEQTMRDLRRVGCDILTIGQYLAPSKGHLPVVSYIDPEQFDTWRARGMEMGFAAVAAGPFVRSSYLAEDVFRNRQRD